jgi:hypothetical protein
VIGGPVGAIVALCKWSEQIKNRRAEFVNRRSEFVYQIMQDLRFGKDGNDDIIKTRYLIEYKEFRFDENFQKSILEQEIDKYLALLNYICYLYETGAISQEDFDVFSYTIARTLYNDDIKEYLQALVAWSLRHDGAPCSFQFLIDYGRKHISDFNV